jgi:4-hydroxy-tetrahydrodipicolinate synthase
MELKGVYTALVTPFRDGAVDEEALHRLIDFQVAQGVDGIVPCGTTGEASTLSYEEHERVTELSVKWAAGRIKVIAGTGSNSTAETIELTDAARKAGVDGVLLVAPYYNRPTPEGLYRHFKKVAEEVNIPIVLYNIPTRTGVNMLPDLVARLSEIPTIVAIKEASGGVQQAAEIYRLTQGRMTILSGDDNLFLPMMSVGAKGVISVLSNIMPGKMKELAGAYLYEKDIDKAMRLNAELLPLFQAIFIEVNPVPIKEALYYMGMISEEFRLPLCPLSEQNAATLRGVLEDYGILRRQ